MDEIKDAQAGLYVCREANGLNTLQALLATGKAASTEGDSSVELMGAALQALIAAFSKDPLCRQAAVNSPQLLLRLSDLLGHTKVGPQTDLQL